MDHVEITPRDPHAFTPVIGAERTAVLADTSAALARELIGERRIVNVNSTATGGGVAEMLHMLLGYVRGIGIDVRWLVIGGNPDFFAVTKRLHNHLYGGPGDGGPLGAEQHAIYADALAPEVAALADCLRPGDVVVLHDPQTAGLAEAAGRRGCTVVWRCHVGIDEQNDHSRVGWEFLRPYLEPYVDHYVFTDAGFAPGWVASDRCSVIWPSIDPFSPKNQDMSDETAEAILTHTGLIAGRTGDTGFVRADGSPGRVERRADVVRAGPPPPPDTPLVVQVSRWDVMKDMEGVMTAFVDHVDPSLGAELVLAGPVVSGVADDPEGEQVLDRVWTAWRDLPGAGRARVQLVCLPMDDLDENAAIVNALQRHAAIVAQKSLAEGFGLTIAEAMIKGTPVVASAVGGIVDQVIDGESGLLIREPTDHREFAAAISSILADDDLRARLGRGARQRAVGSHLGDTHLEKWLGAIGALLGSDEPL